MGYMLTTSDNPYDPHEQFRAWYAYDLSQGRDTAGYLARVLRTSNELAEAAQGDDIEEAIDEIIRENPFMNYVKLEYENEDTFVPAR